MGIVSIGRLAAAAAAIFAVMSTATAQMPVVPGEPARAVKAAPAPVLRLPPASGNAVLLSPITDSEVASIRQANRQSTKRILIGVERRLGAAPVASARELAWTAVAGGFAAQASVTSPGAGAMRLAIDLAGVPAEVEMVFFGSDAPDGLLGPVRVGAIGDRAAPWWSPLTDGETQTVEFFVPGAASPATLALGISGASHAFTTLASRMAKRTQEIGDAGSCNVDVKCSPLAGTQAFRDMRNAVVQMVFNEGGFTGLCTGQVLADTDPATQIPWLYGANHCFENESLPYKTPAQMQAVASTLNTLWFFESVSCGVNTAPPYSQLVGGATYIDNNPGADVLFLRLNDAPPAGAYLAGWDANPIDVGASIVIVHHPLGDLKKVSQGNVLRFTGPQPAIPGGATTSFTEVHYTSGTTEGGSSGGGLWTFDGTQYRLRGALYGGGALCTAIDESDWYSRFDRVYAGLARYLAPVATAIDYSDLWWNAGESGWGLNIVQHASRNIFAVWYTYGANGKPAWFTLPGGTWTSSNTFTGPVYSTAGPPASAGFFDPARVAVTPAGTGTLTFSDANNATWSYTVNGVSESRAITRQPF